MQFAQMTFCTMYLKRLLWFSALLTTIFSFQPELIRSYGYPVEEHSVVTEDGYILTLHRIPHGSKDSTNNSSSTHKVPVLLGHCMVASSAVWSFMPNHSLAYTLADNGKLS